MKKQPDNKSHNSEFNINRFYLNYIIKDIESVLPDKPDIRELSKICYRSVRQMYRDFFSATGYTINEYVRKRRLSDTLLKLKDTKLNISETARQCGYSSQQSFCREVKEITGVSALRLKNSERIFYFPRFDASEFLHVHIKTEELPRTFYFDYLDSSTEKIELNAVRYITKFYPNISGRIFGRYLKSENGLFRYRIYIEDKSENSLIFNDSKKQISKIWTQPRLYAKLFISDFSEIKEAKDYLSDKWTEKYNFQKTFHPAFEEFILSKGKLKKTVLFMTVKNPDNSIKSTMAR